MDKILGIAFTIIFGALAIFPLFIMWRTDRDLSKQIEELEKKIKDDNEYLKNYENGN